MGVSSVVQGGAARPHPPLNFRRWYW